MEFIYSMPTKLFVGSLRKYSQEFEGFGKKAFIVTGRGSATMNGSLYDVALILEHAGIDCIVYNQIDENPDTVGVELAAAAGIKENVDFVIGIGGGSPMDAAKAVSLLIKNPGLRAMELYTKLNAEHLPLILIPTTAGSGSETTPFSVLTVHEKKTKISIANPVFAQKAFINASYTNYLPDNVTLSTAIDAFTHLAEGYLSASANYMSDRIAEGGLTVFGECIPNLRARKFHDIRERLMITAAIGGMVISHTKTTLPHQMGYALTYYKDIPHGYACGLTLCEYLRFYPNKDKVYRVLRLTGFSNIEELQSFFNDVINIDVKVSSNELKLYSDSLMSNPSKLKNHPGIVRAEDLMEIYENSFRNK